MYNLPQLGDIVSIEENKFISAESKAHYVVTRLNDEMLPVEVTSLSKNKYHNAGDIITHRKLSNFLKPISVKASDMINQTVMNWSKESNELEPLTIVHFIGNNRELKFVIIDDKLVSNIEFEFYVTFQELKKGRIGIDLSKKNKTDAFKKITNSITKIAQDFKFLFPTS
jgi:hypothetical protein